MGTLQTKARLTSIVATLCVAALVAGCGQRIGVTDPDADRIIGDGDSAREREQRSGTTLGDAFRAGRNAEASVSVNKYIWSATIEVLDFLPIQTVDPFTGVIVTGFGTPPGGGGTYRATVLISDPALDARSLNVALQTRSGPASASAVRAVEDAILTRARQLRIADNRL
ncbi:DUF3576 domain-containing protein [uncultured Tateyamaria sp.]|uniref:DUF3576 domain-containing protein n=1 Tax=Tateyamaria sp. TaxID=1929288 RepID=UPI0026329E37|nr:DUF3576 domain-containing protein [uncultured Tateyamaria sp.]